MAYDRQTSASKTQWREMLKKIVTALLLLSVFLGAVLYSFTFTEHSETGSACCAFCNPQVVEEQKFYEDDLVIALVTHKPIMPGHVLVIPKRHVERLENLSEAEVVRIYQTIRKVHRAVSQVFGTSSYLILQKNGIEVGQSVPHVHFHYIPRAPGDTSSLMFLINFYISGFKSTISKQEIRTSVEAIKSVIDKDLSY